MIGRPVRINWRKEDTPETLKAAYLAQRDSILRTRLHGLWLYGRVGGSVRRREWWGCMSERFRTWVRWYREGGVEEVLAHKMGGRGQPRYLSVEQERELTEEVSTGRFRTAGEIRDWIESEYAVSYTSGSVYTLLARLGCSPRCLVVLMRRRRTGTKVLEKGGLCRALADAGVSSDTAFGFADEMRVGLRGWFVGYGVVVE